MYAYGYGNLADGIGAPVTRQLLKLIPCAGCEVCTANCVKGFNLRGKITDISRLANVPCDLIAKTD